MTFKVGTKGYLKLGDNFEDPHWREALGVAIDREWLQCLVRCKRLEVDQSGLSSVETDEGIFVLIQTPFNHLLSGVPGAFKALEADEKILLGEGLKAVHSEEDLTFATVSDTKLKTSTALVKKGKRKESSSASPSPSSEEEGADLAMALRRKWLGDGTRQGKRRDLEGALSPRKPSRFAMTEKKSKDRDRGRTSSDQQQRPFTRVDAPSSSDLCRAC